MTTAKRRRATLLDVASKAGVAVSTASVVLSFKDNVVPVAEKTKARVLAAARQLDYVPNAAARALNTRRSGAVGVVGGEATHTEAERMRGIRRFLEARGYSIRVLPQTPHGPLLSACLDAHRSQSIDGLITIGGWRQLGHDNILEMVNDGMPIVTAEVEARDPQVPSVELSTYEGYRTIMSHLIDHGYGDIAVIAGSRYSWPARECIRAYSDVLAAAGMPYKEQYVIEGDWHPSSGYYCMKELLDRGIPIRAVQAGNDMMAVGAMRAIRERGLRIPEDVAVTGYDDDFFSCQTSPELTTVEQPFFRVGNEAAALLYDLLDGKQPIWTPRLPVTLVPRESCGCTLPEAHAYSKAANGLDARQNPDNTPIELSDQVVSAAFGHVFYMQDREATSGIGVRWHDAVGPEYVQPGDVVSVNGRVLTAYREKLIRDHYVVRTGRIEAPKPISVTPTQLATKTALGSLLGVVVAVKGTVATFSSDRTRCVTIEGADGARANVLLMETDYYPQIGNRIAVEGVSVEGFGGIPSVLALNIRSA